MGREPAFGRISLSVPHHMNISLTRAALFRSQHPATGGIMTPISKDFEFGKVLGTGGFAVVKMAKHVRTDSSTQ